MKEKNISFKVKDEDLVNLLLQHLEVEGCIKPDMRKHFVDINRSGRATMVNFSFEPREDLKPKEDFKGVWELPERVGNDGNKRKLL